MNMTFKQEKINKYITPQKQTNEGNNEITLSTIEQEQTPQEPFSIAKGNIILGELCLDLVENEKIEDSLNSSKKFQSTPNVMKKSKRGRSTTCKPQAIELTANNAKNNKEENEINLNNYVSVMSKEEEKSVKHNLNETKNEKDSFESILLQNKDYPDYIGHYFREYYYKLFNQLKNEYKNGKPN